MTPTLQSLNQTFTRDVTITGVSTVAASFLITTALIVIACASLCFMLPGVNALTHIVLPAYLPAVIALAGSLPLIVCSVIFAKRKNEAHKALIEEHVRLLNNVQINDKNFLANYIVTTFFKKGWSKEYKAKLIDSIKESYPKEESEQTPEQKVRIEALDKAKEKIYENS